MLSDDILFSSVRTLGEAIRTRKLSPVELTNAYLQRLETIGPKLNAVVTVTRDLALAQAKAAEKEIAAGKYRGPLHGIPYGAKDAFAARGIPTTWGTAPYRNQVFDYDATIVTRLADAGAVLLGKLAMVELVGGLGYNTADASFTGPGRTPWNRDYFSGGSSSGPAAATSAALVAFSVGGETGGSIVQPSASCGLSGMRTTYGRVSRHGSASLCWTLDKIGPICRTADDCGLVLNAIAGYDKLDPATSRREFQYARATRTRKFKVAVVNGSYERAQPEVRANFEKSLEPIARFATVEHVDFPDYPYGAILSTILYSEGTAAFRELVDTGRMREMQNHADRIGGYIGMTISAVDYLQAQRVRKLARLAVDQLLSKYDALLGPTTTSVARRIDEPFNRPPQPGRGASGGAAPAVALVPAGNIAGVPAITVPNGFSDNRLPTSLQFLGAAWSEATLIALADAYQQATDWHTRRPPTSKL
jgi:Asp-tRNA(Asn)/Glu-tRNA(Gln) amidotransferase A subunit family amidase